MTLPNNYYIETEENLIRAFNGYDVEIGKVKIRYQFNFKELIRFIGEPLAPIANDIMNSTHLVVDEIEVEYDFKYMGIGSRLMKEVEVYAKQRDAEYIMLQVFPVYTEELEYEYRVHLQQELVTYYSNRGYSILIHKACNTGELDLIIMYKKVE